MATRRSSAPVPDDIAFVAGQVVGPMNGQGEARDARAVLRAWLRGTDIPQQTASDVLLVAKDLFGNPVMHDGGDEITVCAAAHGKDVSLHVVTVDVGQANLCGRRAPHSRPGGRQWPSHREGLDQGFAVRREGHVRTVSCSLGASPSG